MPSRFTGAVNPESNVVFQGPPESGKVYVAGLYTDKTIDEVKFSRRWPTRFQPVKHIRTRNGNPVNRAYWNGGYREIVTLAEVARGLAHVEHSCADCQGVIPYEHWRLYVRPDGQPVCRNCAANYRHCSGCAVRHPTGAMHYRQSYGYHYCDTCFAQFRGECSHCAVERFRDELHPNPVAPTSQERYCSHCFERLFFVCDSCAIPLPRTQRDLSMPSMCRTCASESETDQEEASDDYRRFGELIHGYGHKPKPQMHGNEKRQFGIELEVNTTNSIQGDARRVLGLLNGSLDHESTAYLKQDGSIGTGFEIVTHPHTMKMQRELWRPFFAKKPLGMTSYKSGMCGMHIHISRIGLRQMTIRRMLVFVNDPRNLQYIATVAQRTSPRYSKLEEKKITTYFSSERFEAINMTNRNTVELRIFRGTVKMERFYKNLDFTEALIEFCDQTNLDKLNVPTFLAFVGKQKTRWKFLHNFHIERGISTGKPLNPVRNQAIAA